MIQLKHAEHEADARCAEHWFPLLDVLCKLQSSSLAESSFSPHHHHWPTDPFHLNAPKCIQMHSDELRCTLMHVSNSAGQACRLIQLPYLAKPALLWDSQPRVGGTFKWLWADFMFFRQFVIFSFAFHLLSNFLFSHRPYEYGFPTSCNLCSPGTTPKH